MTKFKNKYRVESHRKKHWDYASAATYFITICCKNRISHFGTVINGEMKLSEIGKIVETQWLKTIDMRPDMNLTMGKFVVMPNHFHAIISIGKNEYNKQQDVNCNAYSETQSIASLAQFGPQSKNLASIIRGFKTGVTVNARIYQKSNDLINQQFAWQPNYHDLIIRNDKSFHNISNYIINNPGK